jgi:Ca2+-binding RTX toxin-like protein
VALLGVETGDLQPFPTLREGRDVSTQPGVDLADLVADAGSVAAQGDTALEVTFVSERAGLRNSLGAYTVEADGTISDVQILFTNAQQIGRGGALIPNRSTAVYDGAEAGQTVGFFLIENGERILPDAVLAGGGFADPSAGTFVFVEPGATPATAEEAIAARFRIDPSADPATVETPRLVFLPADGSAPLVIEDFARHRIWHSLEQTALNRDGQPHVIAGRDPDSGSLRFGFEDLPGAGDRDFNDLVVDIRPVPQLLADLPEAPLLADPAIADPDSSAMSGIVVTMSNALPGDRLEFSEGYAIANGELTFNGVGTGILAAVSYALPGEVTVTLTGEGPTGLYQDAVASLRFASEDGPVDAADNGNGGVREITVTVTDAEGNVSPDALTTTFTVAPPDSDVTATGGEFFADTGGDTRIAGDDAANAIDAGPGDDFVFGFGGDDTLFGGDGQDVLFGGRGGDTLAGFTGEDQLFGGYGDDTLFGDAGRDRLDGGEGRDRLEGGPGADRLHGGPGNDLLFGDGEEDVLFGGPGDDLLSGGAAGDRFVWEAEDIEPGGVDTLADFDLMEGDSLDLSGALALAPGEEAGDKVTLVADGSDALVRVDADGAGGPAEAFTIRLEGVSVDRLYADTPGVSAGDGEAELVAAMQANNTLIA